MFEESQTEGDRNKMRRQVNRMTGQLKQKAPEQNPMPQSVVYYYNRCIYTYKIIAPITTLIKYLRKNSHKNFLI